METKFTKPPSPKTRNPVRAVISDRGIEQVLSLQSMSKNIKRAPNKGAKPAATAKALRHACQWHKTPLVTVRQLRPRSYGNIYVCHG